MNASPAAPIACTLSADDFKDRATWLRALTSRALLNHQLDGLHLSLTYQLEAAEDVEKMVRQEQECCSFLSYAIHRTAASIRVTVTAPADAGDDARVLFSHLVPD